MSSASIRSTAQRVRLADVVRQRPGNSKLIKGRLQSDPAPGLFPAFSASGQDIFCPAAEFEGDAVVVSAVGARCGKCFLASGKWTAIANTHVLLPDHSRINTKYLWYLVNDERFWIRGGSAQPFVRVKDTLQKDLLLPELHKQRRIVAEIEKQFSRLDQAVASLQRVKAQLKRYKASVLKAAVEGRLVETEAERARRDGRGLETGTELAAQGSANAAGGRKPGAALPYETGEQLLKRILETRRSQWKGKGKYKEPAAPETVGLPELPEGWVWASVGQLALLVEYGSSAKTHEEATGVAVLRMGNIVDGELSLAELKYLPTHHGEFPKLFLEPGDVLFNRTNSQELVGKTAVFMGIPERCSFASYLIRVRLNSGCMPLYLTAYVNSIYGRAWIKAVVTQQVGQANVNGSKLQALNVPLPPLAEQRRIVAEVDRRLSIVREVEAEVDANLRRAECLRQSVLGAAFSGRLTGDAAAAAA